MSIIFVFIFEFILFINFSIFLLCSFLSLSPFGRYMFLFYFIFFLFLRIFFHVLCLFLFFRFQPNIAYFLLHTLISSLHIRNSFWPVLLLLIYLFFCFIKQNYFFELNLGSLFFEHFHHVDFQFFEFLLNF